MSNNAVTFLYSVCFSSLSLAFKAANRQGTTESNVDWPSSEGQWRPLRPEAHEVAGLAERTPEGTEEGRIPYSVVKNPLRKGATLECPMPLASGPLRSLLGDNSPQICLTPQRLQLCFLSPSFLRGSTGGNTFFFFLDEWSDQCPETANRQGTTELTTL
ncbi:hypothetical protein DPX16_14798 [Anabarilius grahami]|uniref:Uncharacterized protein n=1 Tax=Anabarilius grahami TaxID=495550 RepID=A0A3N0YA32_ANAGA|nr:hypothetical protein DPX16_14798 [Anabarilius grahami]